MRAKNDNPTPGALAMRKWRAANREKVNAAQKRYRQNVTYEQQAKWNANRDPESVARYMEKRKDRYRGENRLEFRIRQNAYNYGITAEEYARRRAQPCAICERYDPPAGRGQGMHIDHDHETDSLRGTLCAKCNRGIGMFDDSEALLVKAAEYLAEWKRKTATA